MEQAVSDTDLFRIGAMFFLFFLGQTIAIIGAMWKFATKTETRLAVLEARVATIHDKMIEALHDRIEKVETRLSDIDRRHQ